MPKGYRPEGAGRKPLPPHLKTKMRSYRLTDEQHEIVKDIKRLNLFEQIKEIIKDKIVISIRKDEI